MEHTDTKKSARNSSNGWSGGQYSVVRFSFGLYLAFHFLCTALDSNILLAAPIQTSSSFLPTLMNPFFWSSQSLFSTMLLFLFSLLALTFAIGCWDKIIAPFLLFAVASSSSLLTPFIQPHIDLIFAFLIFHIITPINPWGSVSTIKNGINYKWHIPDKLHHLSWYLCGLIYALDILNTTSSEFILAKLTMNHAVILLEATFISCLFIKKHRPYLWGLSVIITLLGFGSAGLFLNLLMFSPSWIKRKYINEKPTIFFDGHCGLCHRWIKFVLSEDLRINPFTFAPLQSETFKALKVPESIDSIVVRRSNENLYRSKAVIYILNSLGGLWRIVAIFISIFPESALDHLYNFIARIRTLLFAPPAETCPIVPAEIRSKFIDL